MTGSVHHIGLQASSPSALARQWQQASGFAHIAEDEQHVLFAAPNAFVELTASETRPAYRAVNTPGITHVCVQAHAMHALYDTFAAVGAAFHSAPVSLGTDNLYCYARDAEHNVVELEALPYAPPEQQPWLAHIAFASQAAERLAAFYAALLNHEPAAETAVRVIPGPPLGPSPAYDTILALENAVMQPFWVIGANVRGVFLGMKHAAPAMHNGGAIVNIASVSGLSGSRGIIAYTASKHAVIGMTKNAALELASLGIRVNAVCPAPTATDMIRRLENTLAPDDPAAVRQQLQASIPLQRYGEPHEIAAAVAFLASSQAGFITGAALTVDGGMLAS